MIVHDLGKLRRSLGRWLARARGTRVEIAVFTMHDLRGHPEGPLVALRDHPGEPCLVDALLRDCRWYGASGLSFALDGAHPYVRTLIELDQGICTTYEGSYLEAYWNVWRPANQAEYLRLGSADCHHLLLRTPAIHAILPWAEAAYAAYMERKGWLERPDYRALVEDGCPPARSCGPKPTWFGQARFGNLVAVDQSIRSTGFREVDVRSTHHSDTPIVCTCLLRDGEVRFLIADGQHRAASLAASGHHAASVLIQPPRPRGPSWVARHEAREWPLVRLGIFSERDAVAVFDRVFDGTPPQAVRRPDQVPRPARAAPTAKAQGHGQPVGAAPEADHALDSTCVAADVVPS